MRAICFKSGLRACVLALSLGLTPLALPALAQNTGGQTNSASQSTRQTTTTTTTTQSAQPAGQTTHVTTHENASSNSPTLYWIIGLAVLALVVIVAIVALSRRNRGTVD